MFVYMGMVEQKINEHLQAYAYIQNKNGAPLYTEIENAQSDEDSQVQNKSKVSDMVDDLQNKFHHTGVKEDEPEQSSSDDADLFSAPMNSEAFMAKIAQ